MSKQENEARFARLEQFSTEELQELLRGEIASTDEGDDALVFRILEVMETREASPDAQQQTQAAWERFQRCYNTPEGENQSLYPVTAEPEAFVADNTQKQASTASYVPARSRGYRYVAFAAAVIAALMVCMVTAQAAGLDVFGAIARWSEETFGFTPTSDVLPAENHRPPPLPRNQKFVNDIQEGLGELGLPLDLAPIWFPEGYDMGGMEVTWLPEWNTVYCPFTNNTDDFFFFSADNYITPSAMQSLIYEKDKTPVETYLSHGREFYILSNLDTMTAAWSDGHNVITIAGSLTRDELKQIIDSMEG